MFFEMAAIRLLFHFSSEGLLIQTPLSTGKSFGIKREQFMQRPSKLFRKPIRLMTAKART